MHLFFDLDGTLTDPFVGIERSIKYALAELGRSEPLGDDLQWCVGPPLRDSFLSLLENDSEAADLAVGTYRDRYREKGYAENQLYPGIPSLLRALTDQGFPLHLATAKPIVFAETIIDLFEMREFFSSLNGSELDGTRADKADLIRHILCEQNIHSKDAIMIGDRSHDVIGASANNVPAYGVLWGYGTMEELADAGAHCCVETPEELLEKIGPLGAD
ncbi:MAG: HAD hydrolase-like protein [Verrucomicrobiales bacterium]